MTRVTLLLVAALAAVAGVGSLAAATAKAVRLPSKFAIQNTNRFPTRLAEGPDGRIYATDAAVGSVFVYDPALQMLGELKGLSTPLGVAVNAKGKLYVGSQGRHRVEVYNSKGKLKQVIGAGTLQMPNSLAFDRAGNLYVADSQSDVVKVFNPKGKWLRDIGASGTGDGQMRFPSALTVAYRSDGNGGADSGELYVADQANARVVVFDLAGNFLRKYGLPVPAFSKKWQGKFTRLQSLAVDAQGRLHAGDCHLSNVQILDSMTGAYLSFYGSYGSAAGQFRVLEGILITRGGQVVAADSGNRRVVVAYTVQ